MTVRIPLSNRDREIVAYALLDDVDEALNSRTWHLSSNGYANTNTAAPDGRWNQLGMHRVVLGLGFGDEREADHINRNKLDNRRSNLRIVTRAQNLQNLSSKSGTTSEYRGVSWFTRSGKWRATVCINGHQHYLGLYADEREAARTVARFRAQHMPFSVEDPALLGEAA